MTGYRSASSGSRSADGSTTADAFSAGRHSGLIRHSVWTFLSNIVLPLTSVATGPILARALGPDGRGLLAAVLAPIFVAKAATLTALPSAATYAVAKLRHPARDVALRSSSLAFGYGVVASVLLWLLAPTLLSQTPTGVTLLRRVVWTLPILMTAMTLHGVVLGQRQFDLTNTERAVAAISRMLMLAGLAFAGYLTVTAAVWTELATTALAALVLFVALARPSGKGGAPAATGRPLTRELAVYGALGWGGIIAALVNFRLDQAVLAMFVDTRQIGFYAVAVSLTYIPAALGAARTVFFAEAAHSNDLSLVARASSCILVLSIAVLFISLPLAGPAIELLFGNDFSPATRLAQVLLIGTVPFVVEQVIAVGLLSAGRPGQQSLGQATAAAFTLVGLFTLLPRIGVMGAAITSVVAYTASCVVSAALFCRESGIPWRSLVIPRRRDVVWLRERIRTRLGRRR